MNKFGELIDLITQFFKDINLELKRISWPAWKETVRSTGAVIVISIILAGFLGFIDFIFSMAVKVLLG
ncbi:MAG: preprotein translocase subunit SecE [Candidatus Dadabacteria bacterium]|nr:preprotein translocase subunit SecE [Candidatus Dadabacteria bacterium]